MAANFQQHMGGPGQMIPQQQQQQRPQQQQGNQNNNASSQIQQHIYTMLQQQAGPLSGWQAQVLSTERMGLIFSIIGNLRLASQNQNNSPPLQRMIEIGIKVEKEIFDKAAHKEQYKHDISDKLRLLQEKRNAHQADLQAQITQQAQAQAQAQQASQAQQMMMNQQGMQGQGPRQMAQQQQSFQHLQHQMQASPLPGQPPQQTPMGMSNQGPPQNMQQLSQQQQFHLALQQQQQQQQQQGSVPRPGPQGGLTQQDAPRVMELAAVMFATTSDQDKMNIRQRFISTLNQEALQRLQATNMDPLQSYFRNAAATQVRQEKMARIAQQGGMPQQGQNVPVTAPPMQPQRSMQPSPMNGQAQPPPSMSATPEYSQFMTGMDNAPPTIKHNAVAQQQQGVLAQQAGQMVVPVSGAGDAAPQPGAMNSREMLMSEQMGANPTQRAQMQQQMFNAQQLLQHQRMQQAQQPQARINAQAQAQQNMGLQGQPGGMNGPMPQQPSPALQNINQPMRTQGQQMPNPETPQPGPNGPFGQPLDPRFMQANQRNAMGATGMNAAGGMNGFPNIPAERLAQIPPDKLEEMMVKWGQNRSQGMNPANVPGGRPQMPMQGNSQVRPGQHNPQQPGQFNAQQAVAQFMMANPGQRPPPALTAGMTPQQQLMLSQQMATMRPNPNMQRPANFMPVDQRNSQMENVDIPQVLLVHQHMPQGFPPEVKKWGQMKHWVSQNPAMGPPHLDAVNKLQRSHLQMIMKQRQQPQPGGMQPGTPISQGGAPPNPVGMGAAPVATMVPNPMQMGPGNGMGGPPQMRQTISAQDILHARTQAGPKLAQATDDQIRNFLVARQAHAQGQMNSQQQQLLRQQQMQIQANRMAQLNNGQPPHQPQQQPNPNAAASNPAKPHNQVQQPKPSQPEPATNSAASRPRTQQQQQNARNSAQNSSPAQPPNKLKRASSDDVIEVPNPNAQQPRPTPHTTQDKPQVSQQPQQFNKALTPEQILALNPEDRKKYDAMVQRAQSQSNPLRDLTPEQQERFRKIVSEEQVTSRNPLSDIPMNAETKKRMQASLQAVLPHAKNVAKVIPRWFAVTLDDGRTRKYFWTYFRFCKQFVDGNAMTKFRETFSITPKEVDSFKGILESIVIDMKTKHPGLLKGDAARPQPASAPQPAPQAAQPVPPPSTPLSSANLQQQQAQLKLHQRSNSKSSHTPAAPTSSQPPFQLGAASPHGTPIYNSRTGLTQENLHLPARKKQKPNIGTPAGQITPGSNASPKIAKSVSPEMKRQQPPDVKPARPSLSCPETECTTNNLTFDTEEALRKHQQEEHVKPLENPLNFALDQLSNLIGLDSRGKSKKPVPPAQALSKGAKMAPSASKQVNAPNVKSGSTPSGATPMMRQASMNRQASATGKPSIPTKDAVKSQSGQKEASKQPEPQTSLDPWAESTIDPTELFSTFSTFETGAGGAISDMNVYRSITPNDTPESSKDGVSEPNSDISEGVNLDLNLDMTFDEHWQPFDDTAMLDMNGYSNNDDALNMFDHMETSAMEQSADYQSWDDLVDSSMFDKPFQMDTSGFDMRNIDFN